MHRRLAAERVAGWIKETKLGIESSLIPLWCRWLGTGPICDYLRLWPAVCAGAESLLHREPCS